MAALPKEISAFMEKYSVESDELWQVHGKNWVILHRALERVAAEVGVVWGAPTMIETKLSEGIVALCVFGTLGERSEWSIGEASPKNNKNSYPYAMAEKRAKDRVILKLLNTHGDLYSEAEADDFTQRQNPHVTRPSDIVPPADYDENGEVIDNVPHAEQTQKLRVVDQRPIFEALQKELHANKQYSDALAFVNNEATVDRVKNLKTDWQDIFRGLCKEHLISLRPDTRMAG